MKLKICGMKFAKNIEQVANLEPDYLGFIFYKKSKRNIEGTIPKISDSITKTGVFVNREINSVILLIKKHKLDAVQLHGDESVDYIKKLKQELDKIYLQKIEIIKVFKINGEFNFDLLKPFLKIVDYFLFDAKGKLEGGNSVKFDWSVLKEYPYDKPFFLSGGIGIDDVKIVKEIFQSKLPVYAIDVNSKFEIEAGVKNLELLNEFKESLN